MHKKIILLFVSAFFSTVAVSQTPLQKWIDCDYNVHKDPEVIALQSKVLLRAFEEDATPIMFSLNRKVTAQERRVIEKYVQKVELCRTELIKGSNTTKSADPKQKSSQDELLNQLKDGQISLAEFSLKRLQVAISTKLEMENWEKQQKIQEKIELENLEKERQRQAELNQVVHLSCLIESGSLSGIEAQFQINEATKTIWASRGSPPSQINIGPTQISFKQGETMHVTISRSTGRFTIHYASIISNGRCETVKQLKF